MTSIILADGVLLGLQVELADSTSYGLLQVIYASLRFVVENSVQLLVH